MNPTGIFSPSDILQIPHQTSAQNRWVMDKLTVRPHTLANIGLVP